jgi:glycerophosphoryl diester phosphodiesterase
LLAFERALTQGADALELDTRTTADDVPIIFHDDTLDRTTNGRGPVGLKPADELRVLDAGAGQQIPLLSEVLEHFAGVPLILEIKEPRASAAVKQVLARHDAQRRVLVSAFEHASLAPFGAGWSRSASRVEAALFWAAARLRMPRWGGRYCAFTVPERQGRLRVVDERFVALARKVAKPVHVWTVDDQAQAERLRAMGVNGLITNFPARLRRVDG